MISFENFGDLLKLDIGAFAAKPTSIEGDQKEATLVLWTSANAKMETGIWECTPGRFTADRSAAAEFCHFLQGRIVMTHVDGTRRELGPGDAIMLPRGWKGTWEIVEQTRKIYAFLSDPALG